VFLNTKIPFYKAILGGKVRIPTIDGDVELKIPKGSQADDKISLRGRGIKQLRGTTRGDQIVTLKVELPRYREKDRLGLIITHCFRYHRSLRNEHQTIIEKYAELVDPEYRKD
jgi:molecular chaperone DnaJ